MPQQVLEEADHVRRAQRALRHLQEKLAGRRDATDGGQVIAGEWRV
jgi:hypothetical protein